MATLNPWRDCPDWCKEDRLHAHVGSQEVGIAEVQILLTGQHIAIDQQCYEVVDADKGETRFCFDENHPQDPDPEGRHPMTPVPRHWRSRFDPEGDPILRPDWDEYFLGGAEWASSRADCTRRKVGALIVKNSRIEATGYNGGKAGGPSCLAGQCPRGQQTIEQHPGYEQGNNDYSDCIAIHAEANALLQADRTSIEGATLYVTCEPCKECWKLIGNSGLSKVCWVERVGGRERLRKEWV